MRFASLFAGVGGFDLAFERAGMECVAQVEIDARCREVLAAHWPDVPRFGDVHEVHAAGLCDPSRRSSERRQGSDTITRRRRANQVERPGILDNGGRGVLVDVKRVPISDSDSGGTTCERCLPPVDVLVGGFPCQDYSVAGKRGGLAGDRGALWWQFHRLIAECRPRWVVGENVPGLLSSNSGRDFGAIVGSLVELGYGVIWRVLDAQYFGVAQRRRRVFIVGHSGGIPRPEILAFAEGCAGDTPPVRRSGTGTAGHVATSLKASGKYDHVGDEARLILGFDWTQTGAQPLDDMSPTLRVGSGLGIPSGPVVAFAQNARNEIRDLGDIAGALNQPGTKQTTYLASPQVRRLTPMECERLQGFPDNWTAGQSDTQRYRQMGNAVAVPVAEWIARRLVAA